MQSIREQRQQRREANQQNAEQAFYQNLSELETLVAAMQEKIRLAKKEAPKAKTIHWAHVGNLQHLNHQMRELHEFSTNSRIVNFEMKK